MTIKEQICKIAEYTGQRVYFREWSNFYQRYIDSNKPTIMQCEKGWERDKTITLGVDYWGNLDFAIVDIYHVKSKRWYIITFEEGKMYLQENFINGDIRYIVDDTKRVQRIINNLKRELNECNNL